MPDNNTRRLIVVSNRLPIAVSRDNGILHVSQGSGGLVTALAPVLKNRGGLWIGWPGSADEDLDGPLRKFSREAGYILRPVTLDERDVKGFYHGFSNEILWPLFHEFEIPHDYLPSYWEAYCTANGKFAEVAAASSGPGDFIWVHDYHLMLQASLLKQRNIERRVGFFLHIPFPPADIFLKLPWRKQLVDALLDFGLLGFQTVRDRRNFFEVVKRLYPGALKRVRGMMATLWAGGKVLRIGTFPISIDYPDFVDIASHRTTKNSAEEIRAAFGNRFLIFGADRLDYTKGIPQRINALSEALTSYPELHERICMVLVLVPSREEVPKYQAMKVEIERMVGEVNGRFATPGWTPVHYVYRSMPREELVGYYMAADMAMVTPLRDGMNLVAKEYVACNLTGQGQLCLSEFAGAAMEFHLYAAMINPFDIKGTAAAIRQAVDMDLSERRRKMQRMRRILRRHDIFKWVDNFLLAAVSKRLEDFPTQGDEAWLDADAVSGPPWDKEV